MTSQEPKASEFSKNTTDGVKRFYYTNIKNLTRARIILENLVYVIGLSADLANESKLLGPKFFGQYGRIEKLVVNKNKIYNAKGTNGPSYSAYITFARKEDAALCVLCLDDTIVHNHLLKASFGTTKLLFN